MASVALPAIHASLAPPTSEFRMVISGFGLVLALVCADGLAGRGYHRAVMLGAMALFVLASGAV
jgi:hypothetical protein